MENMAFVANVTGKEVLVGLTLAFKHAGLKVNAISTHETLVRTGHMPCLTAKRWRSINLDFREKRTEKW